MSSTTVTRAVTKMVRSYFPKAEKSFPIVEQLRASTSQKDRGSQPIQRKVQFGPAAYVIGGRLINPFAASSVNFTYSRTMLGKRPTSPGGSSRPFKRQATSSLEEGGLDDDPSLALPLPPPASRNLPTALDFSIASHASYRRLATLKFTNYAALKNISANTTVLQLRVMPPPYCPIDLVDPALTPWTFETDGCSKLSLGRSPTLLGASDNLCATFGFLHVEFKEDLLSFCQELHEFLLTVSI
ncbi:hypothetical protein M422DRAFT_244062 [Sphaerobolus stellatus SS14]|nr:hypothetical protein M422DRAFT_244062 [Sphaerobolus stellatus SS14]